MAIKIKKSDLTKELALFIRTNLSFIPKETTFTNKSHFFETPQKDPIIFLMSDSEYVFLPYTFGRILCQEHSELHKYLPSNDSQKESEIYQNVDFSFKGSLFERQIPVIQKSMEDLNQYCTTTVGVYPGFGKTVIGAYLAADRKYLTCVLYHRTILGDQWENTFKEFTNASIWKIGSKMKPSNPQVILCMDTRVKEIPIQYRERIGTLIIDEAHTFCTPSRVSTLLSFQPKYIIAETATLERDDGMHIMIQSVCGVHGIFQISENPFTVVKFMTQVVPETKKNVQGKLDWSSLIRSLSLNQVRNNMVYSIIENNPQHKIMVLTSLKSHVDLLTNDIQNRGISVDSMSGSKKSYSDSRVLVGTLSKIGTGFDEKSACSDFRGQRIDLLINLHSIKSLPLIEQSIGRVFRADRPIVIDFVDNHTTLNSHWRIRKKWYESRNGVISEQIINSDHFTPTEPPNLDDWEKNLFSEDNQYKKVKTRKDLPTGNKSGKIYLDDCGNKSGKIYLDDWENLLSEYKEVKTEKNQGRSI